ncbi:hypothetical protein P170DRAFT_425677 [Aspergillus steynii IBT 23096]|uniref:BTB domain-containing protein n=1 Tax=Aspergillus steynii IBT 23096 TaxID=1392250 RepID=A0A2I2G6Y2_9EURO|nr:uncharacterized protein P170DRAFT_425677 [Aspergillus steynii IBT 23096]PLB48639.1 hypothetical protein P170DRAFT_425677 [Aspergillus steynii IBT 23096]
MPDYSEICRSSQFTFLVGKQRTPIKVHSAVFKECSRPLAALINNGIMKESTDRVAVLADVDPEVFTAVCEYAYTGSYKSPSLDPADNQVMRLLSSALDEIMASLPTLATQSYNLLAEPGTARYVERCKTLSSKLSDLRTALSVNGVACALFHAKLYIFATKYLVEELRQLSLRSIYQDLTRYFFSTDEICDLLEYVYRHTGSVEHDGRSSLRRMLIRYVAVRMWRYSSDKRFSDMLQSNGEIGADLIQKLLL